jgi:DMSO/TMAO reductase YedYZ molybdopterin-dependent catalytic subunit
MSSPVCLETPLERQSGLITPVELFFHRNHFFPFPTSWQGLRIEGALSRSLTVDVGELERFPSKTLVATVECAGNGRSLMPSPPEGEEPWGLGAVSTAEWTGVPLADLLAVAPLVGSAVEVGFFGADGYARSLPVEAAMHPDTLLVTAMNGVPLPLEHGGPLRLLVPRWYGMASVKWLVRVAGLTEPYQGHFQVERYVIDGLPVREMRVRAVVTEPPAGSVVARPAIRLAGYAWTGQGQVSRVRVSDDRGEHWLEADLVSAAHPYHWVRWEVDWRPRGSGPLEVLARASDSAGRVQPLEPVSNLLGYCNNACASHSLTVS